jgi:hypothetical protein
LPFGLGLTVMTATPLPGTIGPTVGAAGGPMTSGKDAADAADVPPSPVAVDLKV